MRPRPERAAGSDSRERPPYLRLLPAASPPRPPRRGILRFLGPGMVAGASDNDPTSVATLAVIGASTVYSLTWLVLLVLPMLATIQVISARVGLVTRQSLERVIRRQFGHFWAMVAMGLLLGVGVFTIGADLEGGAAALSLLTGLPWQVFVAPLAAAIGLMLVLGSYDEVQRCLRYVAVVFLAYVGAAILAQPDWLDVLRHTFIPTFSPTRSFIAGALALLGTTLTSYVYFWETIEEQEERHLPSRLRQVELDAAVGIAVTVLIFWFIVVTTGATLGVRGQSVETVQDAAQALVPIAGPHAGHLFAIGLLASAVLAVPVLAATNAYVLSDAFGWKAGLSERVRRETGPFYGAMLASLGVGAGMALFGIEPIRLLFLAGIIGGLGTPVLLAMLLLLARSPDVMGDRRIPAWVAAIGWATAAIVSLAGLAYLTLPALSTLGILRD
ncbi:MAG: divalent metal cation transporter [Chloroflexi bacterium]|nr:divalent metal cation transporter [Chloroflexota bacterium]